MQTRRDGGILSARFEQELRAAADAEYSRYGRQYGSWLRKEAKCAVGVSVLFCTTERITVFVYCEQQTVEKAQ